MTDTQEKKTGETSKFIRDSRELFYNIPHGISGNAPENVMNSKHELTFHIWTSPSSDMHAHENYLELFIVTNGKLLHQFGNRSTVMQTGDAFLIFPGQYHQHRQYKHYTSQHINLTCSLPRAAAMFKSLCGTENPEISKQSIHFNDSEFSVVKDIQALILRSQTDHYMNAAVQSLYSFACPKRLRKAPRYYPNGCSSLCKSWKASTFPIPYR